MMDRLPFRKRGEKYVVFLTKRRFGFVFVLSSIIFFSDRCNAQLFEAFAVGQQMNGDKTTTAGKELEVSDNIMGGVGAGINIDNFNLNMVFLFGSTEITMEQIVLPVELFGVEANLDYSILSSDLSPVISAGIGSINFTDSMVAPESLNETNFSYNFAGGLRGVLFEHFLLKTTYKVTWTKIKETDGAIQFSGISFALGYIF